MKISASVYSNKKDKLKTIIQNLDDNQVDLFHIDCNDDLSVFEDIVEIRKYSDKPIDLHIITDTPEKYFNALIKTPVEYVTFQYENLKQKLVLPTEIKGKKGLAIITPTPIDVFEEYAPNFDFILVMATIPGKSGGTFDPINFRKIRQFNKRYPEKRIHVDGGVNGEVSFIIRNMGVYAAVSGSYLFNEGQVGKALLNLKATDTASHYLVKDFMRSGDEIPLLSPDKRTLRDVLLSIEKANMGFTMLVDNEGKLEGLISNADVRRGLIKHINNLADTSIEDMVNKTPVKVNSNDTVTDLLKTIKSKSFPISFLPVVNDENQVQGAVTFFNLVKGEF